MPQPARFEIATGAEFRRKYPGYFEERARSMPPIDPRVVPEELVRLVPFAERWGITVAAWLRTEFCEAATPEMVASFKEALAGTHRHFEDWSYTEPADDEPDKDKAAAINYAQYRFRAMYLAEMESFGGRGLRGFHAWYQEYDPAGYERWIRS